MVFLDSKLEEVTELFWLDDEMDEELESELEELLLEEQEDELSASFFFLILLDFS